ncbi:DNA polymerase beta domain-containing protein region/nucleotidyltransferase family protein [Natronococcus amylolyticus DSM 10524]|uniref:DNA polymerase beta domain-containing protein region/nucleotidyltransferase family protein n=1 Tax=Natronococcus amylolyticus DSM 10524 TaxID=1227497 RepID=L9X4D8_9EURY|nr:nucleotidyltransferase domain-containing protein [Natronococcus amylolyticus]ELY56550.1 DNA polymerase beta domain-containing protein region/nucleotidyltransferase family protein [Natronococcus amylolyticus DSM 10524]
MDNKVKQQSIALPIPLPNEDVFRHTACGPILSLLTDTPHSAFGIRDLGRAIDRPPRSVSLAVDDLESLDLVTITEGRKKLVQINRDRLNVPDDPILRIPQDEFRDPVRTLKERLLETLEDVTGILLFGSVARGHADRRSDIDCFVLVDDNRATSQKRAHELAQELGDRQFDGDRYAFEILVESSDSATRQADRLQEIFADGLTLYDTGPLQDLKTEVLTNG